MRRHRACMAARAHALIDRRGWRQDGACALKACRRPGAHNENACLRRRTRSREGRHVTLVRVRPCRCFRPGACGAISWATHAEDYPARPITIIVSLAPGTGMDTAVRLYGEKLAQRLGQPVVIENRPGGAGVVAGETIAKGPPDGYTLAVATSAVMAIRPTLFKQRPFDPLTDFVPISHYVKSPFVFIVNPSLPVRSVPEFIKYAKDRPGQISYSSSGIGGAPHLTTELLKQKFGFDMAHVPYRNSPQSIADVAAGHVAASVAEAGASLPLIRDGKLRALAVTSATRFPTLPDVPPLAEAVGMPDLEAVSWHVIFARHDTPRDIVTKLHDEMKSIMAAPEMQQKIMQIGLIPHDTPSVEGIQRYIKAETEKWGTLVRQLGLEGSQ
jgi:tripartite-type tricarboxylate transporter receptor subunit TctC